jgi:hypothetical protein
VETVLKFLGFELELSVDVAFDHPATEVHSATGVLGDHWLIVQVDRDPEHLVWVCAPITPRALQEVTTGRATPRDALRHSSTGTVEVVTVDHGRAVPDRWWPCAALPDELLPHSHRRGSEPPGLVAA